MEANMKKPVPGLVFLSFFIHIVFWAVIVGIIIFTAGYIGKLDYEGYFVNWERMDIPDGEIKSLRAGDKGEILLSMTDGGLYEWRGDSSWEKEEIPSGRGPFPSLNCKSTESGISAAKKYSFTPVQMISVDCSYMDAFTHYDFALTSNGEIWKWERTTADLSMVMSGLIGFTIGLVVCAVISPLFILVIILLVRNKRIVHYIEPLRWYELLLSGIPAVNILLGGFIGSGLYRGGIYLGWIIGTIVGILGTAANIKVFLSKSTKLKKYIFLACISLGLPVIMIFTEFVRISLQ